MTFLIAVLVASSSLALQPIKGLTVHGAADSRLHVVEFVDYACRQSAEIQPDVYRLLSLYGERFRFEVKHLPLREDGTAAKAAMAAAKQGKYWDYRLLLFADLGEGSEELLQEYAERLGLDSERFEKDRQDPGLETLLERDRRDAELLGIRETPALFLNGERVESVAALESAMAPPTDDKTSPELSAELKEVRGEVQKLRSLVEQLFVAVSEIHRATVRPPTPTAAPAEVVPSIDIDEDDPVLGNRGAAVGIVEFSEFQCPFCKRFHDETFKKIRDTYVDTGKLLYVFKDFPLETIHPEARPAALAANCAGKQGTFWEMHHALFEHQESLGETLYGSLANDLGLDGGAFARCLSDAETASEVDKDIASGVANDVGGTPLFFVGSVTNGKLVQARRITGAQPFAAFAAIVDSLLGQP